MKNFSIGRIQLPWVNVVPPIQRTAKKSMPLFEKFDAIHTDPKVKCELTISREGSVGHDSRSSSDESESDIVSISTSVTIPDTDFESLKVIDIAKQAFITEKYHVLHSDLEKLGFFKCNYYDYMIECLRYILLLSTSIYLLKHKWYNLSAIFLGLFWHQLVFTAHDAGHYGITHDFVVDNLIGIFIAAFCGGLSIGWWKRNHNVHHFVTNHPEHDPDIQRESQFHTSPPPLLFFVYIFLTFRPSFFCYFDFIF